MSNFDLYGLKPVVSGMIAELRHKKTSFSDLRRRAARVGRSMSRMSTPSVKPTSDKRTPGAPRLLLGNARTPPMAGRFGDKVGYVDAEHPSAGSGPSTESWSSQEDLSHQEDPALFVSGGLAPGNSSPSLSFGSSGLSVPSSTEWSPTQCRRDSAPHRTRRGPLNLAVIDPHSSATFVGAPDMCPELAQE